jgi:hypothetical protein
MRPGEEECSTFGGGVLGPTESTPAHKLVHDRWLSANETECMVLQDDRWGSKNTHVQAVKYHDDGVYSSLHTHWSLEESLVIRFEIWRLLCPDHMI